MIVQGSRFSSPEVAHCSANEGLQKQSVAVSSPGALTKLHHSPNLLPESTKRTNLPSLLLKDHPVIPVTISSLMSRMGPMALLLTAPIYLFSFLLGDFLSKNR